MWTSPSSCLALSDHDGDPAYTPTYENVALADYPLSRLVYLNTNNDPEKPANPVLNELTRLILSRQGQRIVRRQGVYVPLRAGQVAKSSALLDANP